jgi:tRNA(Ile)-lysidine synthase
VIPHALRRFFRDQEVGPCRLVVAVSGGIDSTALLLALRELGGFELVAAHVNHHLRGAESDGDEAFVLSLGGEVRIADGTLDPGAIRRHGIEAAAREVRHARLQEIRVTSGARFVVTAHQQNDQAETVLMRLQSGSGIAGLRGIHPHRADGVLRPLLDVPRSALQAFLDVRGVTARVDSSNADPRFTRNRVRRVVNAMRAGDVAAIANVAAMARALWPDVERLLDRLPAEASEHEASFALPDDAWLARALLHRHIRRLDPQSRDVSAADLERLRGVAARTSVTRSLELRRDGDRFTLRRTDQAPAAPAPGGRLRQLVQLPPGGEPDFTIRTRREGDRFQPLGLPFQKKLKEFLIDRKIPAGLRDAIPLVIWNGEIVWVAGVEVSERFKVHPGPGDVYEVWIDEDHEDDRD